MISKSVIFFFLACALALANPIQGKPAPQTQNIANIHSWLNVIHKKIKQSYERTVQPFLKTYIALVEASKHVRKYSQDKIERLRSEFLEIITNSRNMLSDVEKSILMRRIADLQKYVNDLINAVSVLAQNTKLQISQKIQPEQQLGSQNAQNPQKPLNNFDFKGLTKGLKDNLNLPVFQPSQSKESPQSRSGLQDIFGNMNFMPNIPSQLSQSVPHNLPTNVNQLGEFISQPGQESLGNNFNGILNQAQGALNGGKRGIPNNTFTSIINNIPKLLEGSDKNMNNMSQTLRIVQKQISIQINQLKDALTQWSKEVEDFLANGKQVVESQSPTGGSLPSVPPSNQGIFSQFGQKIKESIASGVEKFNNVIAGFFGNASKFITG